MFLSEITAPSESKMTKGLQTLPNDAVGLDARVERCKMKHFPLGVRAYVSQNWHKPEFPDPQVIFFEIQLSARIKAASAFP